MKKEEEKTEAPGHNKVFDIIVNTRPKTWDKKEISFRDVVLLAFPNAIFNEQHIYTVTYSKGVDKKPKGSIVEGGEPVHVKDGMVFDVEHNDIS
ncbi:MAG: multiubiquitin domain-containing protein [Cyclobacteriaceae bacterium]|nr:multiubiquitin domain-containing protein [Cyclobacteriaceae bacterium]